MNELLAKMLHPARPLKAAMAALIVCSAALTLTSAPNASAATEWTSWNRTNVNWQSYIRFSSPEFYCAPGVVGGYKIWVYQPESANYNYIAMLNIFVPNAQGGWTYQTQDTLYPNGVSPPAGTWQQLPKVGTGRSWSVPHGNYRLTVEVQVYDLARAGSEVATVEYRGDIPSDYAGGYGAGGYCHA